MAKMLFMTHLVPEVEGCDKVHPVDDKTLMVEAAPSESSLKKEPAESAPGEDNYFAKVWQLQRHLVVFIISSLLIKIIIKNYKL